MARTDTLGNFLTDVADAIRTKKGSEELIAAADFDTEIENLPSGGGGADLSEYFNNEITENVTANTYKYELLKKIPNLIIGNNVIQLSYLFYNYTVNDRAQQSILPKVICGNNVTNMSYIYAISNDNYVNSIDLSGLNTSNVTTMANMFDGRKKVNPLNFSNFNFSKVTNMNNMFKQCEALNTIDLSNLVGEALTTATYMFSNCTNVTKIDLSNLAPTHQVTTSAMFNNCKKLEELYLDKWDLSNFAANANGFFYNCGSSLTDGAVTKVYVKDEACQNWVLTANNGHPSTWTTDNVIIAGSEADLRNA